MVRDTSTTQLIKDLSTKRIYQKNWRVSICSQTHGVKKGKVNEADLIIICFAVT